MSFRTFQNEKKPFQALKTRSLKGRKIAIFLKGLTYGFSPKMAIFLTSFFQAKQARKMSLTIFQNEKTPFQAIKTRRTKSRKIVIFLKGYPMIFGQKCQFLQLLFFSAKQARKMSFTLFYNEKTPFLAIKTRKSKSRKIAIFPKGLTHGFSSKMAIFLTSFFQTIKAKEMSFTIFQNEKTPFQVIKTIRSKSRKITIFPKGLTHGFGPKMPFFSTSLFLGNIGQENFFYYILQRKNRFSRL